jgi:CzcA family heavy metal efflux pump
MLDALLRFSLHHRGLVMAVAGLVLLVGYGALKVLPIGVFPDLDRPRVVVMVEAGGMAPEEIETRITLPIETAIHGASGVQAVRSTSSVGVAIIYVEFDYGMDGLLARQIVNERLALAEDRLPNGIRPQLAPISSIMGQIMVLGMWLEGGPSGKLSAEAELIELRTQADWLVRQRMMKIPGIAQIFSMGGGRKQFQVQIDPQALIQYGVTLEAVRAAVAASNENATGGYLDQHGPQEWLVQAMGRLKTVEDLKKVPVAIRDGRPLALAMLAEVVEAPQTKRGDAAAYVRSATGEVSGGPAVVLTISKQPGGDTRRISQAIRQAIEDLRPMLGPRVKLVPLYAQDQFIERAMANVWHALRDGSLLVSVVLILFLMNLKTTLISLTAIPLSLLTTILAFRYFGLSINTMTLGGLAVAMGELVDDAIVDVENIFRRLRENAARASPRPVLKVVYEASLEVRGCIVYSTVIVCLVFLPLFALSGIEGRLFAPLGVAYVVSILSSLVVSLTVTPVLASWLLAGSKALAHSRESWLLRGLKLPVAAIIRFSLRAPALNLTIALLLVAIAALGLLRLERDFLPPFNEGSVQLNVLLPPGTSLAATVDVNRAVEEALLGISDVQRFVRRTGRAELDEHAEPVNASEYIVDLDPASRQTRPAQLEELRQALSNIPGVVFSVEQPISHLISHMLSGVKAQIGIKIYGEDLERLRSLAAAVKTAIEGIRGVKDLMVEPQAMVPQLRIEYDRDRLLAAGLSVGQINRTIETAMNGQTVSTVVQGQRTFDLTVKLREDARQELQVLRRLPIDLPSGGQLPLEALATIEQAYGPNSISREHVQRRIVIQCNVSERGLVEVVEEIKERLRKEQSELPQGYYFEFGGQFESQQRATRTIAWLFSLALLGILLTLYQMFGSIRLALQVMAAIPMAFIGAVTALVLTHQHLTIASLVGFISLAGIASRNGILLIHHYLHLVEFEGEGWTPSMLVRGGLERLSPVLMTALTAGIALIPLVLAADQPGKEILYPVATVILGGLISSTLLDFLVHPALFWLFGIEAGKQSIARRKPQAG